MLASSRAVLAPGGLTAPPIKFARCGAVGVPWQASPNNGCLRNGNFSVVRSAGREI